MAWRIEFDPAAERELRKLGSEPAKRILRLLAERLSRLDDPRTHCEALQGFRLGEFWKFRVGDYRIIADIQDRLLTIVVIRVGNRRDVYRR